MTNQLYTALENVLKDVDRLEHLQLHFSNNDSHLRGSTFNANFVSNALELIQYISKQISNRNYKLQIEGSEVMVTIDTHNKIVGYDALASLSSLSKNELEEIVWKKRFNFDVRSVRKKAQETTKIRAIFRQNEILELKTVFPGTYAPPFPDEANQSKEEYKQSKEFWDTHVLLY